MTSIEIRELISGTANNKFSQGGIMAKKRVDSDFEDLKLDDEFDFDESEFDDLDDSDIKRGRKKNRGHFIFFAFVAVVLIGCVISLARWNKGETIFVDPDEDTSEFDTEPNDYIQPLTNVQLEGKLDDGVVSIVTIGNSTFADNGEDNYFAAALAEVYNANVYNKGIADSLQTRNNPLGDDSDPDDMNSLYDVTARLVEEDLSAVDCVVISYDISDYIAHKNIFNPGDEDDVTTFCGALSASIKLIQERYPYIRIVVVSTPAAGKTIDDYYVDGTIIDLANGTLNDYIGQEVAVCATRGVSFIDIYFGVINVETRDKYLMDDYHFNEAGAKAVASRIAKLIPLE